MAQRTVSQEAVPPEAIAAAFISALIHASWNALVKAGEDRLAGTFLVGVGSIAFAIVLAALTGPPPWRAWPFLVGSVCIHACYWAALIRGYRLGDLSHVYTLSRGLAPLLVAVGAALTAREAPTPMVALGMGLVSTGVISVGASPGAPWRTSLWALLIAALIGSYSLVDALGARASGDALRYIAWMTFGFSVPLTLFALVRRGPAQLLRAARPQWRIGILAGALSSVGFGIVVWAQTRAPIARVTALRETSVVFAALIAWIFLRERLGPRRWIGALLVACGAAVIAWA